MSKSRFTKTLRLIEHALSLVRKEFANEIPSGSGLWTKESLGVMMDVLNSINEELAGGNQIGTADTLANGLGRMITDHDWRKFGVLEETVLKAVNAYTDLVKVARRKRAIGQGN